MEQGVTNLNRFLLEQQREFPGATGGFTILIESIGFASKIISREVNKAGIVNIIGRAQSTNVHGEDQQKLDVYADKKMIQALDHLGKLCAMASEENDDLILIPSKYPKGKYLAAFDPLDGSSNIDVNISIGTIFGIYKRKDDKEGDGCCEDFYQPGRDMVAAGYILYGSSTMMVYSAGNGVHGFTLDPSVGEYILSHPNMQMPDRGKIYSMNEANYNLWDDATKKYLSYIKNDVDTKYTSRYIGSLVADFHRNLLKGGIFIYPEDKNNPDGKLRLLYECAPLAFIAEQAGGRAVNGKEDILDVVPTGLHQREPLAIGSKYEVDLYMKFKRGEL
ncbi:MAG: class 1 fructose-bisphosphatase [Denitrovibrio sp.]|nr:MAG: class 1 fructose-bisphosphatase [Denitrovibrio sp.]